jgi:hypothetical protein
VSQQFFGCQQNLFIVFSVFDHNAGFAGHFGLFSF